MMSRYSKLYSKFNKFTSNGRLIIGHIGTIELRSVLHIRAFEVPAEDS